ncbi:hypothetical protein TL16_g03280 [Triparma laevis f. inornata]|uniref:Kinesin light chain n=1 Tax=Triparma laevis f. inornata TaxID=1714386 RepID=A0A9W7A277_9STRA|nr:hypothetical protein TL16_g03280 [Triparma laevis f. inornata]
MVTETMSDRSERLRNLVKRVYRNLGNYEKALEYYERALKGSETTMGKTHPQTLATVGNIAIVYNTTEDYGKSEEFYQRSLEGKVAQLGKDHKSTMRCAENYRICLEDSGNSAGQAELRKAYHNV